MGNIEYASNSSVCSELGHLQEIQFALILVGCVYLFSAFLIEHFLHIEQTFYIYSAAYLFLGYDVLLSGFRQLLKAFVLDEMFLMSVATIGAFFIGAYKEACVVMLFFKVGEFLQQRSLEYAKGSISSLLALRPKIARLINKDREILTTPDQVPVGSIIKIRAGETIPLDGKVVEGQSLIDTSLLTGESVPSVASVGDEVLSGSINGNNVIKIKVTRPYNRSTISKVLELIEKSSDRKAIVEKFITRLAKIYTPIVVALAVCITFLPLILEKIGLINTVDSEFSTWLYRGLVFLVISCPCALVLSIPMGFFAGIGRASRMGILVKGANYLELLSKLKTIVWDKTGTLTIGNFKVKKIICFNDKGEDEVLKIAALVESHITHPIAISILEEAKRRNLSLVRKAESVEVVEGKGVKAKMDGSSVVIGNENFLRENGVLITAKGKSLFNTYTRVLVALDGRLLGVILIEDEIKSSAKEAIEALYKLGVKRHIMLTGDVYKKAQEVSNFLGIKEFFAELLPQEKVSYLHQLLSKRKKGEVIGCVGDGINDAPMLRLADVGVAMGEKGIDVAIESADVVLMKDNPMLLKEAVNTGRKTMNIIYQNVTFVLGIKFLVLLLGSVGLANMWMAIFADVGVALLAVVNSMRIF